MATVSKKPLKVGALLLHFAALTFRQLDDLKPEIDMLMRPAGANFSDPEARAAVVKVAMASAESAGNPVTADELKDNLDTVNFGDVITTMFVRNGFVAEEGDEPGEKKAAASMS
jgi:hypothetical protein